MPSRLAPSPRSKLLAVLAVALFPALAVAATERLVQPGLAHFFQVSDHVFRGAQPDSVGWESLARLGVETVIDLRPPAEHDVAGEERMVTAAGMRYVNIPMPGLQTPTSEQIRAALDLMTPEDTVFVHCARGKDRTGAVIAAYRIHQQQWPNQRALKEARSHGLHWYERGKMQFIRAFQPIPATPADSARLVRNSPPVADTVGTAGGR